MGRKKVKLQWILEESARKNAHKKRVKGLLKKVEELSILCEIDAGAVIYGVNDQEPQVWPATEEMKHVVHRFQMKPDYERFRKMSDVEGYMNEKITKLRESITQIEKENHRLNVEYITYQSLVTGELPPNINGHDLNDLGLVVADKLKENNQGNRSLE